MAEFLQVLRYGGKAGSNRAPAQPVPIALQPPPAEPLLQNALDVPGLATHLRVPELSSPPSRPPGLEFDESDEFDELDEVDEIDSTSEPSCSCCCIAFLCTFPITACTSACTCRQQRGPAASLLQQHEPLLCR